MLIICWNTRGLNNPDKWIDIEHLLCKWKPLLITLLESKVNYDKLYGIQIYGVQRWTQFINVHHSHKCRRIDFLNEE